MDPGQYDRRVQIMRRPVILDSEGEDTGQRGDYAPLFSVWGRYVPQSAREAAQGGAAQNVESGVLTIRDSTQARGITNGDRLKIQGRDFNIDGVGLPDRRRGTIQLNVSSNLGGE